MQSNFKNVIFDLGGVLIDWNPRYLYKNIFKDPAIMEDFLNNICTDDWNLKQDAGQTLADGTKELCERFPEKTEQIRAYYNRWPEMLGNEITPTVEILKQLKQNNIKLYALTNWSGETFPIAKKRFDFLNDFLDIVISGVEKILKPDLKLYKILLKRNNIIASECIYIDDREANVEAAKLLGMKGIHFTTPENLAQELKRIGLI